MNPHVTIRTLTDGGQAAVEIAAAIAAFLDGAERTLDLAQYDFDLGAETGRDRRGRAQARGGARRLRPARLQRRPRSPDPRAAAPLAATRS